MQQTTSARRGARRTVGIVVMVAAMAATTTIASSTSAEAYTANRSKPVLLIHGYNPTSNSTDCGATFNRMISQMRAEGYTGPFVRVGFYSGDVNCDVNLRSYHSFGDSSSWREIAKGFSKYVRNTYTVNGVAVDVVGYSMGGLIARGAVYGASNGQSGFSAPINVEDVVTLGTPHNGAAWYSYLCLWGQCATLKPGSSDLNWLNQNGNPQGSAGTDWTVIGSTADGVVPSSSAIYMSVPTARKVVYSNVPHTGSTNYMGSTTVVTRANTALAVLGS